MSAFFNFSSMLTVVLLFICTCAYLRPNIPFIAQNRTGLTGTFFKAARIGERLSPVVATGCMVMAVYVLFLDGLVWK